MTRMLFGFALVAVLCLGGVALAFQQPQDGCSTADGTTGGARLFTPQVGRKSLLLFNANVTRAYCKFTTTDTCSSAASSSNYSFILEGASAANAVGGAFSALLDGSFNVCCATTGTATSICRVEMK